MTSRRQNHMREELRALYFMHQEAVTTFEGQGSIEASMSSFQDVFSAFNRMLREATTPDDFYLEDSPLVRETRTTLAYSSARGCCSDADCDTSMELHHGAGEVLEYQHNSKGPLSPPSFGSDLPMYSRALKFPERATVNQVAFVALYNLALSTHVAAIELSSSQSPTAAGGWGQQQMPKKQPSIRTAAKLWELVYSFQWREALKLKPIHALSILVNLGQAQYLVGNDTESKKCFENIISAIQLMEARNREVPNKSFFLYSAFRMLDGGSAHAAPAA